MDEKGERKGEGVEVYLKKVRNNPWVLLSIVLALVLVVLIFKSGFGGETASISSVSASIVSFAESQGVEVLVKSVVKEGQFYTVTLESEGQEFPVYVTLDGKYMVNGRVPLTASESQEPVSDSESKEIPKTARPKVEIFVMSFCPYGLEGEKLMKPVYDLLKGRVDFKVRYFATPQGETIEQVRSLHGNLEAQEDARQVCIDKYFSSKLWAYLMGIAENCPSAYNNAVELDTCWRAAAKAAAIPEAEVEACYKTEVKDIIQRFNDDGVLVNQYQLGGSESIVINGVLVSPSQYRWDSDKLKTLICSAFTDAPSECSDVVTSVSASAPASGSC